MCLFLHFFFDIFILKTVEKMKGLAILIASLCIAVGAEFTRNGWVMGDLAPLDEILPIKICLKQQNLDLLEEIFWDVSNPESKNFTK